MKCNNLLNKLEEIMPCNLAMDWDNVGLLIGSEKKEINKILVGLDLTKELLDIAIKEKVDSIITHHPLIFSKINKITDSTSLGIKIIDLIKSNISYIAMHTNYDVAPNCMTKASFSKLNMDFKEVLEETNIFGNKSVGIGGISKLDRPMTLGEVAKVIKDKFALEKTVVYGNLDESFDKIAISPGSGKGMYKEARKKSVKLLITGDITHHEGLDAMEEGISIIDAGHYGIEKVFIDDIENKLKDIDNTFDIIKYYKEERSFI